MPKWLRIALIILFSALFLVSAFMIAQYYINSLKQASQFDDLSDMVMQERPTRPALDETPSPSPTDPAATEPVETAPSEPLPEYLEVSALNPDMVGWIQLEGTKLDYPVMHTPDRPEHYLHRDFYGNYSSHGCIFAREQCDVYAPSDNITIYGHNMKDGTMFGVLRNYRSKSYWQDHRYIYFDTLYERHTYEIFAVFTTVATKGKGLAYHQFVDADDQAEFDEYIADCQAAALYDTGITPQYGDKLISLSTCEYSQKNGRLVVVAKRIT